MSEWSDFSWCGKCWCRWATSIKSLAVFLVLVIHHVVTRDAVLVVHHAVNRPLCVLCLIYKHHMSFIIDLHLHESPSLEVLAAPELRGVKMTKKKTLNRVLPPCFGYFLVPHLEIWSLTLLGLQGSLQMQ